MSTSIIRAQMSADLRIAMKTRATATVATLRTLMAMLDNAGAVAVDDSTLPKVATATRYEVPRKELTAEEIRQLLQDELADRQRTQAEFIALGLTHEAERIQHEVDLITAYL